MLHDILNISIAATGSVLLGSLYKRGKEFDSLYKTKRKHQPAMSDLLNYAAVIENGIILNKNGSLMASYLYTMPDDESLSDEQKRAVSVQINAVLIGLGSGWMMHVDAVRRETSAYFDQHKSHFTDQICSAIDNERRNFFERLNNTYTTYFVLTITYLPPNIVDQKMIDLIYDDDSKKTGTKTTKTNEIIHEFKRQLQNIESSLSNYLDLVRLNGNKLTDELETQRIEDDQLRWLNFCLTNDSHPIRLPTNAMYLDSVLGTNDFFTGVIPKIGNNFIQVVSICGFPSTSYPGMLKALNELPCTYRWSTRFIFIEQHEALAKLQKYRRHWTQKIRGIWAQLFNTHNSQKNGDAEMMVIELDDAISQTNSGQIGQGYYTSVVVLMSENREELEKSSRYIKKEINRNGFAARVETVNTVEAFLGSLPGEGLRNVRRPLLNTMNLSDLIPTSTPWLGSKTTPCEHYELGAPAVMQCLTTGQTPFYLNMHVGDLGHFLMFGPSGSGKSTLLATLLAQLRRYKDMKIFAFDKGNSLYVLTSAINTTTGGRSGLHYNVGNDDSKLAFCPLQFIASSQERAWAADWIDKILALNGLQTTAGQRNEIVAALENMNNSGAQTLSEFTLTLQDNDMRDALKQYTRSGTMGHLFDADYDSLSICDFTVFEIEELMSLGDKYALPILWYLFRRIKQSLNGDPACILLDEAWIMLGHETFRAEITDWLKTLRKANCIVGMATQNISDAIRSGIFDILIDNTATKFLLPNLNAEEAGNIEIYTRAGLNRQQIKMVKESVQKREYIVLNEHGCRKIDLALGQFTLAFVGASAKKNVENVKKLQNIHGDKWVNEYLSEKGLNYDF